MLIPLRHENMASRRWPVVTFTIIALNFVIFLGTHSIIDRQEPELAQTKLHLIVLAAMHPELNVPEKAQGFVSSIQFRNSAVWKEAKDSSRAPLDAWDSQIRTQEDPVQLQQEMDALGNRYAGQNSSSLLSKFAFIPAHQTLLSTITASFLHGGWLHLIGNMWFLWLAGAILEDTWGRMIYPVFYLFAGVLAFQVHAMVNVGSYTPTIGASGAIAGLMGAFLVRFPTTKIEMGWLFFVRLYRFKIAAYWLLPLWLATEVLYGTVLGQNSGVAHWAHIGGFAFGALIALAIQKSGLEQMAEEGIQEKISWVSHPLLAEASEQVEKKNSTRPPRLCRNCCWKSRIQSTLTACSSASTGRIVTLPRSAPLSKNSWTWKSSPETTKPLCKPARICEPPAEKNFPHPSGWSIAANWKRRPTFLAPRTNTWSWPNNIQTKNRGFSRKWPRADCS